VVGEWDGAVSPPPAGERWDANLSLIRGGLSHTHMRADRVLDFRFLVCLPAAAPLLSDSQGVCLRVIPSPGLVRLASPDLRTAGVAR
jgi:hypothetical protein